jgi:hypothetical protein
LSCAAPNPAQDRVGEQVVLSFGERSPRLDLNTEVAHQVVLGGALEERVRLDLVESRRDLVVVDEVGQPVGIEDAPS